MPLVWHDDVGDHANERRFTRTIRSKQPKNASGLDREGDSIVGKVCAETLTNVSYGEHGANVRLDVGNSCSLWFDRTS